MDCIVHGVAKSQTRLSDFHSLIFHCIYEPQLLYSFICQWTHLGCFCFLANVNSAALKVGVHVSFWITVFSGYIPRVGWLGHLVVVLFLVFKGISILFFIMVISTNRTRSGTVSRLGASVPVELGCITLLVLETFTDLEALWTPYYWDFFGASSSRHDPLLTPFIAPLPSPGNEEEGLKIQSSNHILFFLGTSPHAGAHPKSPHSNKRHYCHLGYAKRLRSFASGTGLKNKH